MASCEIIEGNLALFNQQVSDEQWKNDDEAAEQCCALEAIVAHGLMIHDHLARHSEMMGEARGVTRETLDAYCHAWRSWLLPSATLLDEIRRFEQLGFSVEDADRFRECVAAAKSMPLDVDEILRLRERFTTPGKTVSMKAALDELLSRAKARGG